MVGTVEFDDILLERFLTVLNRTSKTTPIWRRVAAHRRGRVAVDVTGPEGLTRRCLGIVNNHLTVLHHRDPESSSCPRVVVARDHLLEVTRTPWRYLANPTLLRFELLETAAG